MATFAIPYQNITVQVPDDGQVFTMDGGGVFVRKGNTIYSLSKNVSNDPGKNWAAYGYDLRTLPKYNDASSFSKAMGTFYNNSTPFHPTEDESMFKSTPVSSGEVITQQMSNADPNSKVVSSSLQGTVIDPLGQGGNPNGSLSALPNGGVNPNANYWQSGQGGNPAPVTTLSSQAGQQVVDQNTQDLQKLQQGVFTYDPTKETAAEYTKRTQEAIAAHNPNDPNSAKLLNQPSNNPALASAVKGINDLIASGLANPQQQQQYSSALDTQNEYYSAISSAEAALNSKNYQSMDFFINRAKGLQQQITDSITQLNKDLKPLRDSYIQSLTPGAKEQALATKANDLKGQIDQFKIQTEEDKFREFEGQTLGFAGGRASEIDIRGEFKTMRMNSELNTVLGELGLEQEVRKAQGEGATTQMGWLASDFELQQKVQEKITAEEDKLFTRADTLQGNAKDMLGTLVDMLQGVNPDTIPAQTKLQLQTLAAQAGIPFDVLTQGLKVQYQQQTFDNALKSAQESRLSSDSGGGGAKTESERAAQAVAGFASAFVPGATLANGIPVLDSDGHMTPEAWKAAIADAPAEGLSRKQFIEQFGYLIATNKGTEVSPKYGLTSSELTLISK